MGRRDVVSVRRDVDVMTRHFSVAKRQGLLANTNCLDDHESLSPGQSEEITRVTTAYPHLTDNDFVKQNIDNWLC